MEPDCPPIADGAAAAAAPVRDDFDANVTAIAALGEPVRRTLYRYVVAQADPVNRDQAAEGVGVARHTAKFHLDKLVEDGLLEVKYARPPGRGGPGAGRPTKFYRRSSRQVEVSLPERHYELAGQLLAEAVTEASHGGISVADALRHAAQQTGRELGYEARQQAGTRPSRSALLASTCDVLEGCGYEPRSDASGISLANCPFHALAQEYVDLVCGMNLDLMNGLVESLQLRNLEARLEPASGQCCVRIGKSPTG